MNCWRILEESSKLIGTVFLGSDFKDNLQQHEPKTAIVVNMIELQKKKKIDFLVWI